MNNYRRATGWIKRRNIKMYFLCISMFFLPLSLNWNNISLVLFILVYLLEGNYVQKSKNISTNGWGIAIIASFFFINILGYFFSYFTQQAWEQIQRCIPFFAIPIIFTSQPKLFSEWENKVFLNLVCGCLAAALISWGGLLYELFLNNELYRIFSYEYSRNLTKYIDQHPSYLSMLLFVSIGFMVSKKSLTVTQNRLLKNGIIILLSLFLFHLLSRTAIFYFLTSAAIYLLYHKKYFLLLGGTSLVVLFFLMLFNSAADKSDYFERVLIEQTGFSEEGSIDNRFARWEASWELFRKNPITGVGTGDVKVERAIQHRINGDMTGYKHKYNAHNQFFEFISAQGIIAGAVFIFVFFYLAKLAWVHQEYLYFYIIGGLFCCSMTESIFNRSWGIVFFSIMASLFLTVIVNKKNQKNSSLSFS